MIVTRIRPTSGAWDSTWGDIDQMRREMARLADAMKRGLVPEAGARIFPLVNVTRDQDSFYIRAELPGVHPDALDVTAQENTLVIKGTRELPTEGEEVSYHRREREGGSFSRSVELPAPFDRDRVEARYREGILTLTLPLAEETKPKQIKIRAG